jgi:single-strand DNA-binding protein
MKHMTNLRNKVQLIGNLGLSPEVKEFEDGKKMVKLSIATNDSYRNQKGELIKETQWHNVVAWGKAAKIAEDYLEKGAEVCISGKLTTRSYEDAEGNKKYISEIVMQDLLMLGSKN